jgi:dienelactone hydrolase
MKPLHRSLAILVVAGCTACSGSGSDTAARRSTPSEIRRLTVGVGSPSLKATLTLPAGDRPSAGLVMMSGSGPNDQDERVGPNTPFRDIADGLAAKGIATLRYDKRTKDYPGSVDAATFTATDEYVPDATAALALLRARPEIDRGRVFLLGHSQGGTYAPKVAATAPNVAGVILMAAGAEPFGQTLLRQATYLSHLGGSIGSEAAAQLPAVTALVKQIDAPDLTPSSRIDSALLGGVGAPYILDLRAHDAVASARSLHQPLLILQGERDYQVTVADDLAAWTEGLAGRADVTVHRYPSANHLFIDGRGPPSPAEYDHPGHVDEHVIDDIASWVTSVRTR